MIYLPASDKVLISHDNALKLVARGSGGNGEFFENSISAHLGNHIYGILDEASIFISPSELKCLTDLLDWSRVENDPIVFSFLKRFETSYDGQSVQAPYFEALLSIKGLTRAAVEQFKRIEDQARTIEAQDLTLREQPDDDTTSTGVPEHLNFIDINKLLNVLVGLEDQLYQIANQSGSLSDEAKKVLCQKDMSRPHTALGRLTSLLSLPSDQ